MVALSELGVRLSDLCVKPVFITIQHNSNAEIAEADAEIAKKKLKNCADR